MHVGLISYQTGHLKTLQMILHLMAKSYRITVYASPFTLRPPEKKSFYDRPYQIIDLDIESFCKDYGIDYIPINGWEEKHARVIGKPGTKDAPDVLVTCIAKIIPPWFIRDRIILNCHPGLLPQNRGVDAFKWCVLNRWPFGITLHRIDERIDGGLILARQRIPVLKGDTLKKVSQRAYEMELILLSEFERYLGSACHQWQVGDEYPVSHKLIPAAEDEKIEQTFLSRQNELMALSRDHSFHPHPADLYRAKATRPLNEGHHK